MELPEKIPLEKAVERGLVPCSGCGAPGAAVREVDGKKHFLCPRCAARGRRWIWLAAFGGVGIAAAAWILFSRPGGAPDTPPEAVVLEVKGLVDEAARLLQERKFPEARARLKEALRRAPESPALNLLMGRCLMEMGYYEASVLHWKEAFERDPLSWEDSRLKLGIALFRMGRAAEAMRFLDRPFEEADRERGRRLVLAECCLEMELYEDALKVLEGAPARGEVVRLRHRALSYLGRPDEARRAVRTLDGNSPQDRLLRAVLEASLSREEGDFAAAGKALESAAAGVERGTADWARLRRSEIALQIEAGNREALEAVTDELSGSPEGHVAGVALWGRVIGRLLAGKRDEAAKAAGEFLSRTDPEFTPLRMERLMMLHLAGRLPDDALEAELRAVPRAWQNDLLYYWALARSGDRTLAERALRATPGRNFPYHAIRRLLSN